MHVRNCFYEYVSTWLEPLDVILLWLVTVNQSITTGVTINFTEEYCGLTAINPRKTRGEGVQKQLLFFILAGNQLYDWFTHR